LSRSKNFQASATTPSVGSGCIANRRFDCCWGTLLATASAWHRHSAASRRGCCFHAFCKSRPRPAARRTRDGFVVGVGDSAAAEGASRRCERTTEPRRPRTYTGGCPVSVTQTRSRGPAPPFPGAWPPAHGRPQTPLPRRLDARRPGHRSRASRRRETARTTPGAAPKDRARSAPEIGRSPDVHARPGA
jgi:hypothetical protein